MGQEIRKEKDGFNELLTGQDRLASTGYDILQDKETELDRQ